MAAPLDFFQSSHKSRFVSGFDKYVERDVSWGPDPPPDVYWNPRAGEWQTYAGKDWVISDRNLPSVGKIDFTTNAGSIFDQITEQWSRMDPELQPEAVWDGRRHKWVTAETGTNKSCRDRYEKMLAYLRQKHASGELPDELFKSHAEALFRQYQHCL